jgi:hypothetical protein
MFDRLKSKITLRHKQQRAPPGPGEVLSPKQICLAITLSKKHEEKFDTEPDSRTLLGFMAHQDEEIKRLMGERSEFVDMLVWDLGWKLAQRCLRLRG